MALLWRSDEDSNLAPPKKKEITPEQREKNREAAYKSYHRRIELSRETCRERKRKSRANLKAKSTAPPDASSEVEATDNLENATDPCSPNSQQVKHALPSQRVELATPAHSRVTISPLLCISQGSTPETPTPMSGKPMVGTPETPTPMSRRPMVGMPERPRKTRWKVRPPNPELLKQVMAPMHDRMLASTRKLLDSLKSSRRKVGQVRSAGAGSGESVDETAGTARPTTVPADDSPQTTQASVPADDSPQTTKCKVRWEVRRPTGVGRICDNSIMPEGKTKGYLDYTGPLVTGLPTSPSYSPVIVHRFIALTKVEFEHPSTLRMDDPAPAQYFAEIARKPTIEDLVEITKDWARDTWYTSDSRRFYLRDMRGSTFLIAFGQNVTSLPGNQAPPTRLQWSQGIDIPPAGPEEVRRLTRSHFKRLVKRLPEWDAFITPKADLIANGEDNMDAKIDKLLFLTETSPAGCESKVPGRIEYPSGEERLELCIAELLRKPTSQDLVSIAKDWARLTYFTPNGEEYFLRNRATLEPRCDISPIGRAEVVHMTKAYFNDLVDRMGEYEAYVEPKLRIIAEDPDLPEGNKRDIGFECQVKIAREGTLSDGPGKVMIRTVPWPPSMKVIIIWVPPGELRLVNGDDDTHHLKAAYLGARQTLNQNESAPLKRPRESLTVVQYAVRLQRVLLCSTFSVSSSPHAPSLSELVSNGRPLARKKARVADASHGSIASSGAISPRRPWTPLWNTGCNHDEGKRSGTAQRKYILLNLAGLCVVRIILSAVIAAFLTAVEHLDHEGKIRDLLAGINATKREIQELEQEKANLKARKSRYGHISPKINQLLERLASQEAARLRVLESVAGEEDIDAAEDFRSSSLSPVPPEVEDLPNPHGVGNPAVPPVDPIATPSAATVNEGDADLATLQPEPDVGKSPASPQRKVGGSTTPQKLTIDLPNVDGTPLDPNVGSAPPNPPKSTAAPPNIDGTALNANIGTVPPNPALLKSTPALPTVGGTAAPPNVDGTAPNVSGTAPPSNFDGTTQPNVGGTATQPNVGGAATQPNVEGTATQPNVGGAAAAPNVGGAPAAPNVGGTATQPNVGGAPAAPNVGGTATQPNVGGAPAAPNVGGTATQPNVEGTATQPNVGGSAAAPNVAGIAAAPTVPQPSVKVKTEHLESIGFVPPADVPVSVKVEGKETHTVPKPRPLPKRVKKEEPDCIDLTMDDEEETAEDKSSKKGKGSGSRKRPAPGVESRGGKGKGTAANKRPRIDGDALHGGEIVRTWTSSDQPPPKKTVVDPNEHGATQPMALVDKRTAAMLAIKNEDGEEDEDSPEILTDEQLARENRLLLLASDAALHNYCTHNVWIPSRVRSKARKEQGFLQEAGTLSRVFALSNLILSKKRGLTKCQYHSYIDHAQRAYNDFEFELKAVKGKEGRMRRPKLVPQVTGIPLKASTEVLAPEHFLFKVPSASTSIDVTRLPAADDDPSFIKPQVNGLDEAALLTFFQCSNGEYYLHCGCPLEEVLLEFYIWKSNRLLRSPTTGAEEPLGAPTEPRPRFHYHAFLTALGVRVDNLYQFDAKGNRRNTTNLPEHLERLSKYYGDILPGPPLVRQPRAPIAYVDPEDLEHSGQLGKVQFTSDDEGESESE
ncbi:hypothetical protein DFP72DRAFT_852548 [Ephemerocybe angulata]|uniref:Uncharacterized protein n=1 Tax=Ephemerocybe angulata TaxID=980116 RepID=A0A8H6HPF4_9AGAR|nr:hypothetical protein DFP72DRAFT_852548 [Tulosesus angulatus]